MLISRNSRAPGIQRARSSLAALLLVSIASFGGCAPGVLSDLDRTARAMDNVEAGLASGGASAKACADYSSLCDEAAAICRGILTELQSECQSIQSRCASNLATYCATDGGGSSGCVPKTCASLMAECGSISDGCASTLDCGTCTSGTCGGGDMPNVCASRALYVATTGSDSNPGTKSQPFLTLKKAASAVTAGTIVHVAPGSYATTSETKLATGGTAAARIRYVSDTKWGAKLHEPLWVTGSYIDIVGFDLSPATSVAMAVDATYARIIGNNVHDVPGDCTSMGGAGIQVGNAGATGVAVIGNVVHAIGPSTGSCNYVHGIYLSTSTGAIVQDNQVYGVSGCGIHAYHNPQANVIANNLVFGCRQCGVVVGSDSTSHPADNNVVNNNIIMDSVVGIFECCGAGQTGPNNVYANNLLFHNISGNFSLLTGSQSGSLFVDPLLVNYKSDGSGDYHLTASSPAIDSATSKGAPAFDYDGNSRPFGAGYDRGPFEYQLAR